MCGSHVASETTEEGESYRCTSCHYRSAFEDDPRKGPLVHKFRDLTYALEAYKEADQAEERIRTLQMGGALGQRDAVYDLSGEALQARLRARGFILDLVASSPEIFDLPVHDLDKVLNISETDLEHTGDQRSSALDIVHAALNHEAEHDGVPAEYINCLRLTTEQLRKRILGLEQF